MSTLRADPRYPLIDLLKSLAAQSIVLHHFSAYGPISEAAQRATPVLISVLYEYGRMAVQVFLVIAGYLAAKGLLARPVQGRSLGKAIVNRFLRLLGSYLFAVVAAIASAALARHWLSDDFVPSAPGLAQLLAHAGLLHGVLGYDALSAGVWYVAIDFQLYVALALLMALGAGNTTRTRVLVAGLCLASLFAFNRRAQLDDWAVYFFGSYGLGVFAWWAGSARDGRRGDRAAFVLLLVLAVAALAIDYRARIAIALAVAAALAVDGQRQQAWLPGLHGWIQYLSKTSYALFLTHFPILLLVNTLFAALALRSAAAALACLGLGWALSLLAAHGFHHAVEKPCSRWRWG